MVLLQSDTKLGKPIILDPWQQEVLRYDGNIALRSGRQVGKSTVISIKASEFALASPDKLVMIVAATERQAQLLFDKALGYLADNYRSRLKKGKHRPTRHIINLTNNSRIMCVPTGLSGYGIRGFSVDLLIADEAAFIHQDVWQAVTPMLATTKGKLVLLSTPFGRSGYFYERFSDPTFKTWHIRSDECPRMDLNFLEQEKKRLTKLQYSQEYFGEFVDELRQFFPDEIIKKVMILQRNSNSVEWPTVITSLSSLGDNFLGVDIARMGEDETVLASVTRINREKLQMIDLEITRKTYLTDTIARIKIADRKYDFKKIYIDTGGIGAGVFDPLLQDDECKRKIISIENARRSLDRDDTRTTKLDKEVLYANLLKLMESGAVELFMDDEIALSLKSVQYEYKENGDMKIFGTYTHIAEALVRAAWCMTDKTLDIWAR